MSDVEGKSKAMDEFAVAAAAASVRAQIALLNPQERKARGARKSLYDAKNALAKHDKVIAALTERRKQLASNVERCEKLVAQTKV